MTGIPYLDNTFDNALEGFKRRTGVRPGVIIRFDSGDTFGGKQVYHIEIHALGKSARADVTDISPDIIKEMCGILGREVGGIREIMLSDFDVVPYDGNLFGEALQEVARRG